MLPWCLGVLSFTNIEIYTYNYIYRDIYKYDPKPTFNQNQQKCKPDKEMKLHSGKQTKLAGK